MAILVNESTRVLVQGITGQEGARAVTHMKEYGTVVCAGVTPGKGGQEVEGVPVFDTVDEACARFPEINASIIYVPPAFAADAAREAIGAGIPLVNLITERIPIRDVAWVLEEAEARGVRVVGPSSVGMISPGMAVLGLVGGPNIHRIYTPGPIGVISKSGGMTNETSWVLRQADLGQSTVVACGGDALSGTTIPEVALLFEHDPATHGIVIFGEIGGDAEERVAELVATGQVTKPIAVFVAGKMTTTMPEDMTIGHAGALIQQRGTGSYESKTRMMREAGIAVANQFHELPQLILNAL